MLTPIFERMLELAQPYLDTRNNDLHVRTAYRFAERLLEQIQADPDVVIPAVLLHDLGWKMIPEELQLTAYGPTVKDPALNRRHELEGVRLARQILARVNYDPVRTEEILAIVEGHDSRKVALSVNDQIVKDSDKLWRFSKHGFNFDHSSFGIPAGGYAEWIAGQIDGWFFTAAARAMAWQEIADRKAEIAAAVVESSGNGSKGT